MGKTRPSIILHLYATKYRPNILGEERAGRCSNNIIIIKSIITLVIIIASLKILL